MNAGRLWIIGMLLAISANAAPVVFQTSGHRASLLELYTSEGCSSCPPAERWLSRLKDSSGLWTNFVPVAFHVDYWNYLGWRDRWSSELFSNRQRAYANIWGGDTIYTPEFILNGKEWRRAPGQKNVPSASTASPGTLKVNSDDGTRWHAIFVPTEPRKLQFDIHACLLVSGVGSDVKAGENEGRRLDHDFAALTLVESAMLQSSTVFRAEFMLPPPPAPAKRTLALAVWVTEKGGLEPLQSTGGWLRPADGPK